MAKAKVVITADNQLKGPLKAAQQDLTGFQKVADKVGDSLKKAFSAAAIVAGLKVLKDAVADCVVAFKAQDEAMTRLQASINATGQSYRYTAQDIKTYAQELQSVTRFGDEVIEQTASLLVATQKFDKDGLERTISLSADLAEAMRTDLPSAASTLQKALIEPGEGLNRLRSIGITFTDSEEEMIEQLRAAGKEFEAQEVILSKVEAAYGGMAESIASVDTSTLDKIKNVWGDLKEDLGSLFMNTLGPVFEWIYSTLRWLERLASQVNESANFNKYLANNDVNALANNFTADFLNKELEKREKAFTQQVEYLRDSFPRTWENLRTQLEISFDEFITMDAKAQRAALEDIYSDDPMRVAQILTELSFLNDSNRIQQALAIQEADTMKALVIAEQKKAEEEREIWAKQAQTNRTSVYPWGNSTAAALMAGANTTMWMGYTGTLGPSNYMNSFGSQGINMQKLDAYLIAAYNWVESLPSYPTDRSSGLGLYGTVTSNFGLQNTPLSFKDTMSILGPAKVKQYLDMGSKDIQGILKDFGKYSKTYQEDLQNKNIDAIQSILDNSIEPGSQLHQYFSEILEGMKDDGEEEQKDNRTFLDKFGQNIGAWAAGIFGADESQGKAFGGAVMGSFINNMGTAGEVVGKLATNMVAMGPILGAIATALEYVFQGLSETLGPLLEEFVMYGIEPLREFGRMIGEVLNPLLEALMPLVQKSAESLMNVFNLIGAVLQPIIEIIGMALTPILDTLVNIIDAISPVLDALAKVLIGVVGTIQYLVQGLQHWVAVVFNWLADLDLMGWKPFEGLRMTDPGNPGNYIEFMQGKYADYEAKKASVAQFTEGGSTQTALSSAAYRGATNVTINIYAEGPIVGDGGMKQFARMIRDEFDQLDYYGVSA